MFDQVSSSSSVSIPSGNSACMPFTMLPSTRGNMFPMGAFVPFLMMNIPNMSPQGLNSMTKESLKSEENILRDLTNKPQEIKFIDMVVVENNKKKESTPQELDPENKE